MNKLNCCVTGGTEVMTVDGVKSFSELAESDDDVNVYCLDVDGNIKVSKMFHPRISGIKVEVMKVVLSDGTELNVTPNHMFLTRDGYVPAEDLMTGDQLIVLCDNPVLPVEIDEKDKTFTEYTGTKKGTVIKKCEVSGEEFECIWEEREVCSKDGYEPDLYNIKTKISTVSENYEYKTVDRIEFSNNRENVYNGTVAVYHNYFTIDRKTNTVVNQFN